MSAIYLFTVGAGLDEIEPHTRDMQEAIEEMNRQLPNEVRILEGTHIETYAQVRTALENELSQPKLTEEQWKSALQSGSSTTGPTPISTSVSSNSPSFVDPSTKVIVLATTSDLHESSPTSSCSENSAASGIATDAMNECSECTVPMTSELMLGTPSEAK